MGPPVAVGVFGRSIWCANGCGGMGPNGGGMNIPRGGPMNGGNGGGTILPESGN